MKKFFSIFICICLTAVLIACSSGTNSSMKFDKNATSSDLGNNLSVENSKYRMELDETGAGIILTELSTGRCWKTSPDDEGGEKLDELGMPIKRHSLLESVISVAYLDRQTNTETVIDSATGVTAAGRIRAAKAKNSFLLEFYFDDPEFMIPVEFTLLEDSVRIKINPSKIQEGENKVVSVTVAPFFASAINGKEGSYLFYPSGSGALIATDELSKSGAAYSAEVYGTDASMEKNVVFSNEKSVRLPCFGAVSEQGNGMFAVIDGGAESVQLCVTAGASVYGHSAVYPVFNVRGYTEHEATVYGSTKLTRKIFGKQKINNQLSVRYFPLENGEASYSGMAAVYRKYLKNQNKLRQTSDEERLNITLIGGAMAVKSFFGIPYKSLYPATKANEAEKIIEDLTESTNYALNVQLKGFGVSGADIGKVGSGFAVNSKLGSKKTFKDLNRTAERLNARVYMDFEICKFGKSSPGFSRFFDSAYNAGEKIAAQYLYDKAVNSPIKDSLYYLLRPEKLAHASDKAGKTAKKYGAAGVSLGSFSSLTYSDYKNGSDSSFNSKSGFEKLAAGAYSEIRKNGIKIMSNDSNLYAAVRSDVINDTPSESSRAYIFKTDIPFYQMVFKGVIPIAAESINLAANTSSAVLKAIEGGCGLNYTLVYSVDSSLLDSEQPIFYNSRYEDLKDTIIETANRTVKFYRSVEGSEIKSHTVLGNLRKIEYENGVTVYVNYGGEAVQTESGIVDAGDYLVVGEG